MNLETNYKNLHFQITLEKIVTKDIGSLMGDKFDRLPNQTLIELKKGTLVAYNLIIESSNNLEVRTHYWSKVLLTSNTEEIKEELSYYLEDEEILDSIASNWEIIGNELGPAWAEPNSK